MRITCLRSKGTYGIAALFLVVTSFATSASELPWFQAKDGEVIVNTQSGGEQIIRVPVEVKGVFFDGMQHSVGMHGYFSVFQVADSNPGDPEGVCGSGNEVWLQLMRINGQLSSRILVSSCLESFSLISQNTGMEGQDNDFSSIEWNGDGFSIEWFYKKDSCGRLLKSTTYRECGALFCALNMLE